MTGIYFIIAIVSAAALVEWYKKGLRGIDGDTGRRESKAGAVEVSTFAAMASFAFGVAFCNLSGMDGFCSVGGVSLSIFSLQYLVDMTVVKKAVNAVIDKAANKV